MATQRVPRRPPGHPISQGSALRESSRSPSLKSRTIKSHSMPIVPTAMNIFAASNAAQPSSQALQQPSPPSSINSRRSPPNGHSVQRLLPTPPHPPLNSQDANPDRHASPPPVQHSHNPPNPHYPRPVHRGPPPQFITKYQNLEQENWKMTDEILADIERADLQQSQQARASPPNNFSPTYLQNQTSSPPKDPAVERVRATERSSPKEPDIQRRQQQQAARESPKARERQPTSPTAPVFPQQPSQSPERRASPSPYGSTEHSSGYIQYAREPPPAIRRSSNVPPVESRQIIPSLATQTPPLQSIATRTPDRSLPVQEELEDEPANKNGADLREPWQDLNRNDGQHVRHTGGSPAPSSDLNPEGGYGDHHRDGLASRSGHREESGPSVQQESAGQQRYSDRDREHVEDEDVGGYTPRSPTAELPDHPPTANYFSPPLASRPAQPQVARRHTRNGSTDQLGLPTFDPAVFEGDTGMLVMGSEPPPSQYTEPRRQSQPPVPPAPQQYSQQYSQPQMQYHQSHIQPEEMQHYDSSYIQAYLQSPRPEAPVPPTPHSQTAAPSPSPLMSDNYENNRKQLPFSPVAPVGSPYPYPYNHVRRNQTFSGHPNRPHNPTTFNANELTNIQQQLTRQWQVYAQNHQYGNVSDSTFSPSSTPFEGASFTPWAFLHTNRTLGRPQDTTSIRSSPSHEPVELPSPPTVGVKKANRPMVLRRHRSGRKPPPRVDSTQPRETSPEPSSSGEETAGEERFGAPEDGNWSGGTIAPLPAVVVEDIKDEWIDEEDDDDDLLELEYHQSYVNNVEKRRRKWEVGWEAVTQAVQTLDRQTDATFVLMAAPSHSTKLYAATSRSVRRQSGAAPSAAALKEMRTAFGRIATHRRKSRSYKSSLIDRFLTSSASSGNGSDGSTESREEDLKRALEAALGSLASLGGIYEQREARWHDEMRRVTEDRERVEMLLRQVLGDNHTSGNTNIASRAPSHA